jgi:hypothetical protein
MAIATDIERRVKDEALESEQDAPDPIHTYKITSYGADYDVEGLVRRIGSGAIVIPRFQREFVWTRKQSNRFVESLLLGLPVPGIFLSREVDTEKLLVIDGQQRLRTLEYFYAGVIGERKFALSGVHPSFEGRTYSTLEEEDKRRLDNSILHATIVRQDDPSEDDSSIYYVFQRLNTGGTLLQPQEIRAAIYRGEFNDLLADLNSYEPWRVIFGSPSKRAKDKELILRFLALRTDSESYRPSMEEFLNRFMGKHRHLKRKEGSSFGETFERSVSTIEHALGRRAFRIKTQLNAAIFDSVMIGVSRRLDQGEIQSPRGLRDAYDRLLSRPTYIQAYERATARTDNVKARISLAVEAFANVP